MVPDYEQIDIVIETITSLHLVTEEGSFLFTSDSITDPNEVPSLPTLTGIDSIKRLPSDLWLSSSNCMESRKDRYSPSATNDTPASSIFPVDQCKKENDRYASTSPFRAPETDIPLRNGITTRLSETPT